MTASLRGFLQRLPQSQDLAVAAVLLLAIALMILPMPTAIVDLLIGLNFGLAILLLMTAVYLKSPLELSTLPGVMLIATIFRLALSIATTRLILAEGDAGAIIRTFGEFVIAGSVVVGLVVFFIITIVQLVVIAKGAERVAEVGARFTLDAMPGKQMAIDADLRNGDIDQVEARRRREMLSRESQLYGAMDGAMKFVKGDAMAGIVIILVNLIGGIVIGSAQLGMPFAEALRTYSLLTVGDALISQIPALLLSLAASVVVTRVASANDANLGRDIASQLSMDHRALLMAGGLLAAMGFLPGFPTLTMLTLGGLFAGLGVFRVIVVRRPASPEAETDEGAGGPRAEPTGERTATQRPRVTVRLPARLREGDELTSVRRAADGVRDRVADALGIPLPGVALTADGEAGRCAIAIDGVPELTFALDDDTLVLTGDPRELELLSVEASHEDPLRPGDPKRVTFSRAHEREAADAGLDFLTPDGVVLTALETLLRDRARDFLGIQETRHLLERYERSHAELLKEVLRTSSIQRIADVLRRLLDEHVSVANMRAILEALATWSERERDVVLLTEYVRAALKRQICHQHAGRDGALVCLLVARDVEEKVRGALRETAVGTYLVLDERVSEQIVRDVRERLTLAREKGIFYGVGEAPFVILTTMDVRRYVRSLLARNDVDVPVLSHQELAQGFNTLPIGSLELAPARRGTGAVPEAAE